MFKYLSLFLTLAALSLQAQEVNFDLKVSDNHRYLVTEKQKPFFWLGDTAWLLLKKLNREDAEKYLEDRRKKGFNVIQIIVIHDINEPVNAYGDAAFVNNDPAAPLVTEGNTFEDPEAYDYWDHFDYIIDLARQKGQFVALVPIWGSNVKGGKIPVEKAEVYGTWLAERVKDHKNVIWLNGGDIKGSDQTAFWETLGTALKKPDPSKLMTFHPFGRHDSSTWFHQADWLDFNMFQSGHRRYDQDDSSAFSQDNYKYLEIDLSLKPAKPSIDGEPSYENIPHGLHDTSQPLWNQHDVRRYAYWAVFGGAFGHTYGHNSVMQFYNEGDEASYGAKMIWQEALDAPGAAQMHYLKDLMLSNTYFERVPAQELIAKNQGIKYDYLAGTKGQNYAMVYAFTGRDMDIRLGLIDGKKVLASWFNPRNGQTTPIGTFKNKGIRSFDPPGQAKDGNDWVLLLHSK